MLVRKSSSWTFLQKYKSSYILGESINFSFTVEKSYNTTFINFKLGRHVDLSNIAASVNITFSGQ